jgi:predicted neutral ceramidase superfamily lipid hydrolase
MYIRLAHALAGRYGFSLTLILADYVLLSALSGTIAGRLLTYLVFACTLLVTLLAARARRLWIALALALVGATALVVVWAAFTQTLASYLGLTSALGVCLLLATPVVIVRDIIKTRLVSVQTLLAAMCLYLLIGIIFALLYEFVGTVTQNGFFGSVSAGTITNYLFFSFMTLTTVGYGNLIPATPIGQSLSMLEAILGQIYLIVVVARLVSLWGQYLPGRAPDAVRRRE